MTVRSAPTAAISYKRSGTYCMSRMRPGDTWDQTSTRLSAAIRSAIIQHILLGANLLFRSENR